MGRGWEGLHYLPHPLAVAEEVCDQPLVVCRVYACIADMLSYMAGEAGIRAGPAANISWRYAFALLEVRPNTA